MKQVATQASLNRTIAMPDITPVALNWQNILWRAWRNTQDEEYARHLFRLIVNEPLNKKGQIGLIIAGMFFGGLLGGLLDLNLSNTALPIFVIIISISGGLASWWLAQKISIGMLLASLTPNNIINALAPHYQLLIMVLILSLFLHNNIFIGGLTLGLIAGLILGLIVGVITWPLLLILSFGIFQSENALAPDIISLWLSIGVGLGVGIITGAKPNFKHDYKYRDLCFWWRSPPFPNEVTSALTQAFQTNLQKTNLWKNLLTRLETEKYPQDDPKDYIALLNHDNWQERFIARQALITLGGEAIQGLMEAVVNPNSPYQQDARRLLQAIELETTTRIGAQISQRLCARCLLRCQPYALLLTQDFSCTYYGCRLCHQSQDILEGEIVAILDSAMKPKIIQEPGLIKINYLRYRDLFDFNKVEIIQANDEDVERFAMQIGNDTDLLRKPTYKNIECVIKESSELSENTVRVLETVFNKVVQK